MRKNISPQHIVGASGLRSRVTSCAADKGGVIDLHPEECLICKAPLEYLVRDEDMECAICHKKESSKTRCVNGHYVCNDCHTQGMDTIFGLCLAETSADPAAILRRMMDLSFCHMHGQSTM